MFPCHGCTRHVREGTRTCPFCGATLRSGVSPVHGGFVMGAILGLTLVGCGEPEPDDDQSTGMTNTTPATSAASTGTSGTGTTGPDMTSEAEAADYGTAEPPSDSTGSSGTDTGSTTAGQEGEAADYGGPEGTSG